MFLFGVTSTFVFVQKDSLALVDHFSFVMEGMVTALRGKPNRERRPRSWYLNNNHDDTEEKARHRLDILSGQHVDPLGLDSKFKDEAYLKLKKAILEHFDLEFIQNAEIFCDIWSQGQEQVASYLCISHIHPTMKGVASKIMDVPESDHPFLAQHVFVHVKNNVQKEHRQIDLVRAEVRKSLPECGNDIEVFKKEQLWRQEIRTLQGGGGRLSEIPCALLHSIKRECRRRLVPVVMILKSHS